MISELRARCYTIVQFTRFPFKLSQVQNLCKQSAIDAHFEGWVKTWIDPALRLFSHFLVKAWCSVKSWDRKQFLMKILVCCILYRWYIHRDKEYSRLNGANSQPHRDKILSCDLKLVNMLLEYIKHDFFSHYFLF